MFSKQTELVRPRARAAFAKVVHGAHDAPGGATQQGLYAAHLALLLIWSQDQSSDSKSTHAALEMVCKLTALVCRFRWTPISATMLENIGAICGPLVDPPRIGKRPAAAACLWLTNAIRRLSHEVAAAPPDVGIARVKAAAKNIPAWVAVVTWTSFGAVAAVFLHSSKLF